MNLLHTLHRAEQLGTELFGEAIDIDLTRQQAAILEAVRTASGESQTKLVEATGIDRSTLSSIVRRMLKKGLVKRVRTRNDARTYAVTLTSDGIDALKAARKAAVEAEKQLVKQMPGLKYLCVPAVQAAE